MKVRRVSGVRVRGCKGSGTTCGEGGVGGEGKRVNVTINTVTFIIIIAVVIIIITTTRAINTTIAILINSLIRMIPHLHLIIRIMLKLITVIALTT
jgi:hypothetical protein